MDFKYRTMPELCVTTYNIFETTTYTCMTSMDAFACGVLLFTLYGLHTFIGNVSACLCKRRT